MMTKRILAIKGGIPIRTTLFPNQSQIGEEEKCAVERVMNSKMLSGYRGNAHLFKGGIEVQTLEKMWRSMFGNGYAIACNSATSGLHIACGAIGLKSGDEVIVSPYSMSCSATAPMIYGAIPIFADVEPEYFCISLESIKKHFTSKTKAIIGVNIFGQPMDPKIREFADEKGIYLIEDSAQAVGATWTDKNGCKKYTGSIGHIGVFSFTQGKQLSAGEGGLITTDDPSLAAKCRLLMNHSEAVINDIEEKKLSQWGEIINFTEFHEMPGFNMRMTEIQAAIIQEQLKKYKLNLASRIANAHFIEQELRKIPAIYCPETREGCSNSYYCQPFLWDVSRSQGIHRDAFLDAVCTELMPMEGRESEGVRIGRGYIKPLYRFPIFYSRDDINYMNYPIVESLWKNKLFLHLYVAPPTTILDLVDFVSAFNKIWENRKEL